MLCAETCIAQTADQAWLKYSSTVSLARTSVSVRALGSGLLERSAAQEIRRGIAGSPSISGSQGISGLGAGSGSTVASGAPGEIVLGTLAELRAAFPHLAGPQSLDAEGYWLYRDDAGPRARIVVAGGDERGVLYGAFALLRVLLTGQDSARLNQCSHPALPIRWVDQWDNPDGTIERGYAGRSIFFENGNVRDDLAPVSEYGRLLASVGINGLNVNNVNAAPQLMDATHLKQLARIADALRPWGVRLAVSVAIASPQSMGGLKTYDPLAPAVMAWWAAKADEVYKLIPDFAGFTVKADSEGQPGPASFGRTPADAANTLAAALAPHGGLVLYRAFVYNHHLDWRDPKADRARAAYDIFHPLDGKFAANVIVQTKEGPIDFQVREPVSPLFAGLMQTRQAMELQISQEYTGQQRHLVYLAPMWQHVLRTDLRVNDRAAEVEDVLEGATFHEPAGGLVGVANVGRDHWLASPLALANLYAFGRLAWDPGLHPYRIGYEWAQLTFGADKEVAGTVADMLKRSWPAYEAYTGPLGLQTLTDIVGSHYGPNIEASEHNGWGQWHDADAQGVGKDRSVATGSGYAGQYPPALAKLYEDAATTPDDLLLFFHHVPYTYKLHSGKTVIQHLYDSHYDGAAQAAAFVAQWRTLRPRMEAEDGGAELYREVLRHLEYQAGHAVVWRDAVVQYFLKLSGIADEQGRAGHYPGRLEAEAARLTGYTVMDVTPWEDASGGKAVTCAAADCAAEWTWQGAAGSYDVAVQYFDLAGGAARFRLLVNGRPAGGWTGNATLPPIPPKDVRPNGDTSTRWTLPGVMLKPGDTLRVEGVPDGPDAAALDYIELTAVQDEGAAAGH